jgi:hypothetical protein
MQTPRLHQESEEKRMGRKKRYIAEKYTQFADTEKERRRAIATEQKLSVQDEILWENNDGISQLEGRIETDNFQG